MSYIKWTNKNKLKKKYIKHPCDVYESENMSMVSLPNISDIESQLKLNTYLKKKKYDNSNKLNNNHYISDVQLEAILQAINIMYSKECIDNNCRGFLLGDGTGVGKTRIICSIISELYMRDMSNYRVLWVSANKSLENDAQYELNIVKELKNKCPSWLTKKDLKNKKTIKNGIFFTTYSSIIRETNFELIKNWLTSTNNNVLVFDEAHYAKNNNSKCGRAIVNLQRILNNPRIIYSTATAASDIKQLHYAEKLGLWKNYNQFVYLLDKYGSLAMEMCALQLKHSGKMVCRQLGYDNIKLELKTCALSKDDIEYYNLLNKEWCKLNVYNAIDNLNFYQHLLTSFKMKTVINEINKSLEKNESIVVGVQSTGEIATKRNNTSCIFDLFERNNGDIENYKISGITFPYNPIDIILSVFGSNNVAEISGRQYRPIISKLSENSELEKVPNIKKEISDFQNDIKRIAIITKCGCAGISLHSNKNIENIRKRHHIVLESPRTAELLVQQFGRTNRANSVCTPYYTILVTNVPSEIRFFNGLLSKMQKLGALTKGDKSFNLLNKVEFEGCSILSSKVYKNFILDLNIQISLNWFNKQKQKYENCNLNNLIRGFDSLECYMYTKEKCLLFFIKILANLNDHLFSIEEDSNNNIRPYPIMLRYSSREWSFIWLDLYRGYKFNISHKTLYYMFSSIWTNLIEYLPNRKSLLCLNNDWSPINHKYQSNYIKKIVNTILLCKIRPECKNTFGLLPTHLIHEIIPYFMPSNNLVKMNYNDIYNCFKSGSNQYVSKDGITNFLNKMLKFPINMQNEILPLLRNNSFLSSQSKNKSIKNLESHVLKTSLNCKKFEIIYKKFEIVNSSCYSIDIGAKQRLTLENHIEMYNKLKKNILKFVKFKDNSIKFGMIVFYKKKEKYELWYPGNFYPSRSFIDFQWDIEKSNYIDVDCTDKKWIECLERIYLHNENIASNTLSYKLIFAVNNCIESWQKTNGKLICIKNTGICPDFVGLLYKQKRII